MEQSLREFELKNLEKKEIKVENVTKLEDWRKKREELASRLKNDITIFKVGYAKSIHMYRAFSF